MASTALAMAVTKGVAKDALYLNAWWCRNLAVAVAVAANSDTAQEPLQNKRLLRSLEACQ